MNIRRDRTYAFLAWMAQMKNSGEIDTISFFENLCACSEEGRDAVGFVVDTLLADKYNPDLTDEDVYEVICAFCDFHEMGAAFRYQWNKSMMSSGYADYIEETEKKNVVPPFLDHSVISEFETDDGSDDSDRDDRLNR